MLYTWAECTSRGMAIIDVIIETSHEMSSLPNSTIQRGVPIRNWKYDALEGVNCEGRSISCLKFKGNGLRAKEGSFSCDFCKCSSTFYNFLNTLWRAERPGVCIILQSDLNDLIPQINCWRSNWSFFNLQYCPILFSMTALRFMETQRASSTYNYIYTQ